MKKLYYHGNIITMDKRNSDASAILIEDGIIMAVGNDSLLGLKDAQTECIDLLGKTMLPGFIDGHSHFTGLANSLTQCDLSETASYAEIIVKMKKFIDDNQIKKDEWVVGTNYDHNFLIEKNHPDRFVLDQISLEHPVIIIHASSHMGVVNSLALKKQKLDKNVLDMPGGHYGRDENDDLNGYLEEKAFINFRNKMPMLSETEFMQLMIKAQDIYASYGITTVQEGMVTKPLWQLLKKASESNVLKLDVVGYIDLEHDEKLLLENNKYLKQYQNHLKIGGYKIFLDGSPQGRTAWMQEPYLNSDYCGYPSMSDQHLNDLILKALNKKQQLLAHCNGDQAANQYISQFEMINANYPNLETRRPVMIHSQFVTKEQLKRMVKLEMIPSFFIAHTYYWGDIHIQNFGFPRASRISPANSALKLNLPFTFHQDSPVLKPDVFNSIWCAMNRITKNGIQLAVDECVDIYDALKAVTVNGAYQYFEEDKKGSITKGKAADLVILDQDPLKYPVNKIKVLETIKDGNTVYRCPKEK